MSSDLRGRESNAQVVASSAERLFVRELRELREIGFAEGLPLSDATDAPADALRLECGSMGVAVELFRDDKRHSYRVVSLAPHLHADPPYTSSRWRDIVTVLHNRMRPNDND